MKRNAFYKYIFIETILLIQLPNLIFSANRNNILTLFKRAQKRHPMQTVVLLIYFTE